MPFTGECLAVSFANPYVGSEPADFGDAIRYIYRDADATAFAGGDACLVGMEPSPILLEPGDPAAISWAIEIAPGSAGTIRLSCGLDPTFSLTDPGYATEAIGDHAVTGGQTLVLGPVDSITAADILAGAEMPVLFLEILSGSIDVKQVRLRVWPPTGPQGAWAPGTEFPTTSGAGVQVRRSELQTGASINEGSLAAAMSIARGEYDAHQGTSVEWQSYNDGDQFQVLAKVADDLAPGPTIVWGAQFSSAVVYAMYRPGPADSTTSGTPGIHPDMVPGDYGSSVQAPGGGLLYPELLAWNGGVEIPAEMGAGFPSEPVEFMVAVSTIGIDIVGTSGPYLVPSGFTGVAAGVFEFPAAADVVLTVQSGMWFEDPGAEYEESGFITATEYTVTALVPDHQWWNPDLPWVNPKTPRFFVKDLEGELAPAGFGKPNTEARVFKVPTAMGRWRDLTGVEYDAYIVGEPPVRGRYPLKVKRDDGSMDIVALMVPDV